jgi:hypothetical protein
VRTRGIGAWRSGTDSQNETAMTTTLSRIPAGSVQTMNPLAQTSAVQATKAPPRLTARLRF